MPYDEDVADRIRAVLSTTARVSERRMFGGLAFLVEGAMAVAVSGQGGLMVRCDPALAEELVGRPGVQRMVMHGRETAGWLRVDEAAVDDEAALREWVDTGRRAALRSLAP